MYILTNKKQFLLASLFLFPSLLFSETFCIKNQDEFVDSLAISAQNSENDIIYIVQDSELENIYIPSEQGYIIQIKSGYSSDCASRLILPKVIPEAGQLLLESEMPPPEPQQTTTGPTATEKIESKDETLQPSAVGGGADITVLGVPAYAWRHGCGPTALGMIVGYWDGRGYDKLFDGDATTQTESVDQGMASQNGASGHYEDYSLPEDSYPNLELDRSEDPVGDEHISDSIADFMFTSWSIADNYYGWSWSNHITPAFTNYLQSRDSSYVAITNTYYYDYDSSLSWDVLTSEIDAQRPMIFLVDSNGDGYTDHFVTIVGYRVEGDTQYYGCLDTWYPYETIRWEEFRGMSSSYAWGIWGGYSFDVEEISKPPVIAPWLMLLLEN